MDPHQQRDAAAHGDPEDPRNPNNRLQLDFGFQATDNAAADFGRAFPTTPSTFPQPVFPNQYGQRETWGTQQGQQTGFGGGGYFANNAYQVGGMAGQQSLPQPSAAYRSPGGYNDGTNGLVHQFSYQNLGGNSPRSGSPFQRQTSPSQRPRTAGTPGQPTQYSSQLTTPLPGQNGSMEVDLPPRNPERYSKNVIQRSRLTTELVGAFFRESVQRAKDRNTRSQELEAFMADPNVEQKRKDAAVAKTERTEAGYLRFLRTKESPENFQTLKIIGKGAFGEVKLVARKTDNKIYALKSLVKSEMRKRDQLAHVRSERDILAESDSPWVVKLHTTFQDSVFLYMLMEFLPGGDLMTMLIKYEVFSEDITRFYMAELTLAIEAVHKLGFIHRDIKPDNILLDRMGHVKLTDFGLSTGFHKEHDQNYYQNLIHGKPKKDNRNSVSVDTIPLTISSRTQMNTWRKSRRQLAFSTVGTPDYIAPEIFGGGGYDFRCDWWSLGTIMFECLIGWPPFCGDSNEDTYNKIVNWPQYLNFPSDMALAPAAEDFMRRLMCDQDNRLGRIGGAEDLKGHSFFRGVDWNSLRKINAPFKPNLRSAVDTQYFPIDEIPQTDNSPAIRAKAKAENAHDFADNMLPFVGYTYRRFDAFGR